MSRQSAERDLPAGRKRVVILANPRAGAGSCIVGGLYWRRGTAAGAWASMIVGSLLAVAGIVVQQLDPAFPLNGQILGLIATGAAIVSYVGVSLLTCRRPSNKKYS